MTQAGRPTPDDEMDGAYSHGNRKVTWRTVF